MLNKTKNNINFIILTICIVIFIILLGRIIFLQTSREVNIKEYEDPKVAEEVIRGTIYDRNGKILAIQTTQYSVALDLRYTSDKTEAAKLLSKALRMNLNTVNEKIANAVNRTVLKRGLSKDELEPVYEVRNLPGMRDAIIIEEYEAREYPQTFHLSQIIGFVDTKNNGLDGLEYSLNDILSPYPELNKNITYGSDVNLTIDLDIQYLLDIAVQNIQNSNKPDYIMGIILDGTNGEILASTSYPWYDLKDYSKANEEQFANRVFNYSNEIGSVFKVFSLLALLENDIPTPDFYCNGHSKITHDGHTYTINCTKKHGLVDKNNMISQSCNGAIASWILNLDDDVFLSFIHSLGFGKKVDSGLSGNNPGFIAPTSSWSERSKSTISIGQEISASTVQIVKAATALVNDGCIIEPSIFLDNKNEKIRVAKEGLTQEILSYMNSATLEGTAKKTFNKNIDTSSKTGTAQIFENGKYSKDKYLASILSVVPTENPKYIIYLAAYNPKESIYGSDVCAPEVAKITQGLINQGKIKSKNQVVIAK